MSLKWLYTMTCWIRQVTLRCVSRDVPGKRACVEPYRRRTMRYFTFSPMRERDGWRQPNQRFCDGRFSAASLIATCKMSVGSLQPALRVKEPPPFSSLPSNPS